MCSSSELLSLHDSWPCGKSTLVIPVGLFDAARCQVLGGDDGGASSSSSSSRMVNFVSDTTSAWNKPVRPLSDPSPPPTTVLMGKEEEKIGFRSVDQDGLIVVLGFTESMDVHGVTVIAAQPQLQFGHMDVWKDVPHLTFSDISEYKPHCRVDFAYNEAAPLKISQFQNVHSLTLWIRNAGDRVHMAGIRLLGCKSHLEGVEGGGATPSLTPKKKLAPSATTTSSSSSCTPPRPPNGFGGQDPSVA